MKKDSEPKKELSQAETIAQAVEQAKNKDLVTVKTHKGDSYPLLSLWEVGLSTYTVTSISKGSVELARVMK